ncbi:uncharacterized protein M421DRAFT_414891 [Didymella exigua CBS 183.55]|uniref:Uncharacterized protein n=1 Tax=Didymella exigua CBS 183.55 TaxID=1150837 RepID=A0A6A5S8J8_9PLEO|nr:uncharacterized protein M421DRAFT_414891 [Didymella exigua CBS 183.55]KAF1933837.1 hypothetical protein M421DRAFT_414891 [Didymella exigua CBS 183.55]
MGTLVLRLPTFTRLATFMLLLSPIFAQNDPVISNSNATTTPTSCPLHIHQDFNPDAPINSTGSVNMHWNALMMDPARNDWIFTLMYNETRNRQAPHVVFDTQHKLQSYISAPEASEAQACIHMFGGLNATSSSSELNGCDGVLDDACFNFLGNATFSSGCSLPEPRLKWLEDLREVCGTDVATSLASTSNAQDLTNRTCTIDHPPGSTVPDHYRTWAAMGRGFTERNVDIDPSSFVWYDTYVRQTVPFLVTANFLGGVTETQVVCVAPKEVVDGGRVPARTSVASLSWRSSSLVAVAVAVVANAVGTLA